MSRLSKSAFKGRLNETCHQFTLGKQTEHVEECIELLIAKIAEFQAILKRRKKPAKKDKFGFYEDDDTQ
jgi:hypothetical protein